MVAEPRSRAGGKGGARRRRVARVTGSDSSAFRRDQLVEVQRSRILAGAVQVVGERGASGMAIAEIVQRAGVSRRTFYELFTDREDCLLAAFEDALSCVSERVLVSYEAETGWREQVRAGLAALLGFLDEQSLIGRFLIVDSLAGGPAIRERRSEILDALTRVVERGREQAKTPSAIPPLAGEGIVGGVLRVLHSRVAGRDTKPFVQLTNPLMNMIVLPYLGAPTARKELDRPIPVSSRKPLVEQQLTDPFKNAGMRLTYRTIRVLMAIADHPGISNRLVADTAGINDQGQVSKLLTRLERAGMLENTGLGSSLGAPNVWTLTTHGQHVLSTIRTPINTPRPESHKQ
jgi:AcrR family transcriptional regulator/DNA-binding MarR family transcriptional regulator